MCDYLNKLPFNDIMYNAHNICQVGKHSYWSALNCAKISGKEVLDDFSWENYFTEMWKGLTDEEMPSDYQFVIYNG